MDLLLESIRERLLVQEDIRVAKLLIESILHLLHANNDPVQVTVSRYQEKSVNEGL